MTEKGPRDRAVGIGSKEALVQTRGEGAKQARVHQWSIRMDHEGGHARDRRRVCQSTQADR